MPRKIDKPTVPQARARVRAAIRRYTNAEVDKSWAGISDPMEIGDIRKEVTRSKAALYAAIDDLENAVRRDLGAPEQ